MSLSKQDAAQANVNLGKPSLRRRLEEYYKLVSPVNVSNENEWKSKFDVIYQKYGGSHEGEAKLAKNLRKKYGTSVDLKLAMDAASKATIQPLMKAPSQQQKDETYYEIRPNQVGSRVLNMMSYRFDPYYAIVEACENEVWEANPSTRNAPLMNHLEECKSLLPPCDPLFVQRRHTKPKQEVPWQRKVPVFASLASALDKGPLSLLHRCMFQRHRVRLLIRQGKGIRGTLTGYILAFDKHMNMILKDVHEVYMLPVRNSDVRNAQIGSYAFHNDNMKERQPARQRYMKQIMVRGDNVVLVYRAEQVQKERRVS